MSDHREPNGSPPWQGVVEEDHIPPLRLMFAESLVAHRGVVRECADLLDSGDTPEVVGATATRLYGVAHQISGTAATFLGHDLGIAARAVTDHLSTVDYKARDLSQEDRAQLLSGARQMGREIDRFLRWVSAGRQDR